MGGELLSNELKVTAQHLNRADLVAVLHPPNYSDSRKSAHQVFHKAQHLLNKVNQNLSAVAVELTGDVPSDTKFLATLSQEIKETGRMGNIGVILDTEHQTHKGTNISSLIQQYRELISAVHLKDYDGTPFGSDGDRRYIRYGEGQVEFSEIFSCIRDSSMPLILEGKYKRKDALLTDLLTLRSDADRAMEVHNGN